MSRRAGDDDDEKQTQEKLMDDHLASVGLHRKRVAKDGSCLFRAVAEQVLHCQSLHLQLRAQCVDFLRQHRDVYEAFIEGDFEAYLQRLEDPQQWAGEVEMNALAIMFARDFVIFQEPGKPPVDITGNKFIEKVQLAFLNGNHYDSVYPVGRIKNAALCQSILYELLYADVFRASRQAVASCRSGGRACKRLSDDGMAPCASSDDSDADDSFTSDGGRTRGRRGGGLLLPESARRSLSESLFRNVAYDVWHKSKKAQLKRDYCLAVGMQFTVGQPCQLWRDGSEESYDAVVEEVPSGDGLVMVYTQQEGQLRVPLWSLRPVTSESPGWSAALARERDICNGQPEAARGTLGQKSSRCPTPGPSGRAHQQRYRRSTPDAGSFGLTEEERLAKEEHLKKVALVEIRLRDQLSFPALGSPLEDAGTLSPSAGERQKSATGPLPSTDASPPRTSSAVPSSSFAAASVPAPTFIAPIAPSPGAARASLARLPSASPSSSSSSPQVTDALRLSAHRQIKCPFAGDAGSVSVLDDEGAATWEQRAAQELKDRVADVGGKARDPPHGQKPQVQSGPTSCPPTDPTLQNPTSALPVGPPQLLAAPSFPPGQPPSLPGGILVHHLYQDPLYPGFPQGDDGNVLPAPEFSLRGSGEDLPQDVNVLRFFFNLGLKAYTWPFYMPYLYLLPLQQAHIMQPRVQPAHCPPPRPAGEPANGYPDALPWQRHPAAPSGTQTPPFAVLPSYPRDPLAAGLHRGCVPVNAALADNIGEEAMNVMPRPDISPALGRTVALAHLPAGGHTAPPPHHPSVGCNTDEADESSASRRYGGGGRRRGGGGYRRRRGRQPANYF